MFTSVNISDQVTLQPKVNAIFEIKLKINFVGFAVRNIYSVNKKTIKREEGSICIERKGFKEIYANNFLPFTHEI